MTMPDLIVVLAARVGRMPDGAERRELESELRTLQNLYVPRGKR